MIHQLQNDYNTVDIPDALNKLHSRYRVDTLQRLDTDTPVTGWIYLNCSTHATYLSQGEYA